MTWCGDPRAKTEPVTCAAWGGHESSRKHPGLGADLGKPMEASTVSAEGRACWTVDFPAHSHLLASARDCRPESSGPCPPPTHSVVPHTDLTSSESIRPSAPTGPLHPVPDPTSADALPHRLCPIISHSRCPFLSYLGDSLSKVCHNSHSGMWGQGPLWH